MRRPYSVAAVTASSFPAASPASRGSRSRQRRCIHSQRSGWRRTYISSTSVQRCVNSRTASGESVARRRHGVLVDEPVASAGQRQREHRDHRSARPQRQRRQRGGRRGRAAEEVHVHRVGRVQMLVDQDRDATIRRQLPQHLADRALPVDHRVARARADALEHVVQMRVVERPRQHRHRLARAARARSPASPSSRSVR